MKILTRCDVELIRNITRIKRKKKTWRTDESIVWTGVIFFDDSDYVPIIWIVIPKDMKIYFDIIPPFVASLLPVKETELFPYIAHDYLYRRPYGKVDNQMLRLSRAEIDKLLLVWMKDFDVPLWKRWIIYSSARLFGRDKFGHKGAGRISGYVPT